MPQQNLIEVDIPTSDSNKIKEAIGLLKSALLPHLKTLSLLDRRGMAKMGDKTTAFVQKALDYSEVNKDLIPGYLDLDAFRADMRAVTILRNIEQELRPILNAPSDSILLSGSEAYQAALIFYNSVKIAAQKNLANATAIYGDLSARFPSTFLKRRNIA